MSIGVMSEEWCLIAVAAQVVYRGNVNRLGPWGPGSGVGFRVAQKGLHTPVHTNNKSGDFPLNPNTSLPMLLQYSTSLDTPSADHTYILIRTPMEAQVHQSAHLAAAVICVRLMSNVTRVVWLPFFTVSGEKKDAVRIYASVWDRVLACVQQNYAVANLNVDWAPTTRTLPPFKSTMYLHMNKQQGDVAALIEW